jgi:hypothetical protein
MGPCGRGNLSRCFRPIFDSIRNAELRRNMNGLRDPSARGHIEQVHCWRRLIAGFPVTLTKHRFLGSGQPDEPCPARALETC